MSQSDEYYIEYDLNGKVIQVSDALALFMGIPPRRLLGLTYSDIIKSSIQSDEFHKKFWDDLKQGKTRDEVNTLVLGDKKYKIFETYIPKRNAKGFVSKIISYIDIFVTDKKKTYQVMLDVEDDKSHKADIKNSYLNINASQNEMKEKLEEMKRKNTERLKKLNDNMDDLGMGLL
jgi:PAS domain-containing protein